ncbi:COX15/CtaA family protein, partial [Alicyclobacillus sp.]|uniref:COX15/CtaA family protein n=1 Tax=Alicyclobacillus sp. TaxID=61169 RepID=UPI0025C02AE6
LFSNPPALIAVHLGVALTAFVSLFLLAVVLSPGGAGRHRAAGVAREQEHGTTDVPFRGQQAAAGVAREQEPETVPRARGTGDPAMARAFEGTRRQNTGRALQRLSWVVAVYVYVASYIGAYVASTGYGALFSGWPLPTERPDVVGVAFWVDVLHRVAALGFVGLAGALVVMARREAMVRPDVYRASVAMLGLVGLQALSGALLIATHIRVWAFLLHVTIVTGLFVDAGYLVLRTTTTGRREAVRPEAVEDGATAVTPDMV